MSCWLHPVHVHIADPSNYQKQSKIRAEVVPRPLGAFTGAGGGMGL